MTMRIAVPVILARMRVVVDQGIHWSPIERLLLWSLSETPSTPADIAVEINLPVRFVSEMVWKLMRFGWVEVAPDGTAFRPTMAGLRALHVPDGLPSLAWPDQRTVRAVIEPTQGRAFPTSEVIVRHERDVRAMAAQHQIHWLESNEIVLPSFEELSNAAQACMQSSDEEFVRIIPERSKADLRFIIVTVHGNEYHGLPKGVPSSLIDLVLRAAEQEEGKALSVSRMTPETVPRQSVVGIAINDDEIILDGSSHREVLGKILRAAHHRIVLHSTFLSLKSFEGLRDDFRVAVRQGARVDILYGADKDDRTRQRNGSEARAINDAVACDPVLRQSVRVHMRSTQSHAKLVVADTGKSDTFVAIVGSCNWLSTPYKRVEASVIVRDGRMIAQILRAIGEMSFAVARSSPLVGDLDDIAKLIERQAGPEGNAAVRLVLGEEHGLMMHRARDEARSNIWVGADRFGQVAEVKTLIPMMTAGKGGVEGRVMFSRCVTPVSEEDLGDLAFEAGESKVALVEIDEGVLHGKFLIWDDDNVVITSLNWSSAGTRRDNPWGEIGLHVCRPGLGLILRSRIEESLETAKIARLEEVRTHPEVLRRQRRR
jgi:cardiolipin synthase A/B